MSTETIIEPVVLPADRDPSHLTHVVNCPPGKKSTEAWISEARVFGLVVEALCGVRFVPSRDPERHPVCGACVDAAGIIVADVLGGLS